MSHCEVRGARRFFSDAGGTGTPVLFVHPAAATSEGWVNQLEPFCAAGYRCVTFDLRGYGRSIVSDAQADVGVMSEGSQVTARAARRRLASAYTSAGSGPLRAAATF